MKYERIEFMVNKEKIKESCKRAIKNIIYESCTDVDLFNKPFEIEYLKEKTFQEHVCDTITKAILTGKISGLRLHKLGHVLMPKKSLFDFRKCALTEIYDEIVYLTLVLIIARDIEAARISKGTNCVFSYRYKYFESGRIFDPKYNYTAFRKEVSRKACLKKNKVMIECDLSNFYDRLNIHRVDSTLKSIEKLDRDIIDLINESLLFWANRDSYGLPVGSNASRILAETALIEIDNYLKANKVDFCRFVDDYRIFAPDSYTAHTQLAMLVQRLSKEGITLNAQKTRFIDVSDWTIGKKKIQTKENEETREKLDDKMEEELTENNRNRSKIIRGYSGLVPTKFRELTVSQIEKHKEKNLDEMMRLLKNTILIDPESLTDLIKTIVAQEKYEYLKDIPELLKKYPQFIPYFIDVVIKKGSNLDNQSKAIIKGSFINWFSDEAPEYIRIYIVRLLSSEVINDKECLLNLFRNLKRNSGEYIGRAILEALDGKLTRGETLELRDYFYRADNWERRQILKIVQESIPETECRPFMKDIAIYTDDIFLNWMKSSYKKEKLFSKSGKGD